MSALMTKCYACDAPGTGIRDRTLEAERAVLPACARHQEAPEIKPGELVIDRNYGRTCVVLAVRRSSLLVALQMKTTSRKGKPRYQVRWRPTRDVGRTYGRGPAMAVGLGARALQAKFDGFASPEGRTRQGTLRGAVAKLKAVRS